jgi:hypothetical protein
MYTNNKGPARFPFFTEVLPLAKPHCHGLDPARSGQLTATLIGLSFAYLIAFPDAAIAEVSTVRCDGPDYDAECSLAEMIDDAGVIIFIEPQQPQLNISVPSGAPALDMFNTDYSQVKVVPLEGFPGPGVRYEPEPGTWSIGGNESVNGSSLADLSLWVGNQFDINVHDQVWYTVQTTTTYTADTENVVCGGTYGGEGGWVDGTLLVRGEFFANNVQFLGLADFSAPSERVTFRNDQGATVVEQAGRIEFGDHENIGMLRYIWPQVEFTVTDCGTAAVDSAEVAAIELRFVDSESLPPDADGDGYPDEQDAFPNDPMEWLDTDEDGIGNNADSDDDNDGIPDDVDPYPLGRFSDVPPNHWAVTFIEILAESGITAGCGTGNYCPSNPVTRAQMAVFLERGIHGSNFSPPVATGDVFMDVGAGDFAASFIEQFALDGITAGCGNNNYCPDDEVTRAQMAVFLLRAKHGSGYSPPSASGVFSDVSLNHWAVHWIEQLAAEKITSGCGNGNYCPGATVTRDQMAVFLVRTFGL